MKIAFFSTQKYDKTFFQQANQQYHFELDFFDEKLTINTVSLAIDHDAVCVFVNDQVTASVVQQLAKFGIKTIALRCAGFNNVDLEAVKTCGLQLVRVPKYSPYAVAEHALALLMALNRKLHKAYNRVREHNFTLDGLLGFDIYGKTVGVIGMGEIGRHFARIMYGMGCRILAFDPCQNEQPGVNYVDLATLYQQSHIISLHCPLTPKTRHIINQSAVDVMCDGVFLINTGRGALIDTAAVINGLKCQKIAGLGLDVYEQEESLFFADHSMEIIDDELFERLLTFPNVLITGHQAFFTDEALHNIASVTLNSLHCLQSNGCCENSVQLT